MAVTVADILGVQGLPLRLVAGARNTGRPIRWVHVSELDDPTPWLKGGEVILTTGMGVGATPAKRRAYVQRLADAGLAGLGFGLGFSHERIPKAIVTAAEQAGFPLFEVPYPVPFIAITEAVFTRLLAEQYDTLQRAVDAEHALTRAVLEGSGVEAIARSLSDITSGWAMLLDLHGTVLASTSPVASKRVDRVWAEIRASRPEGTSFSLTLVDRGDHIWIQPVGAHGRVEAFLAVGKREHATPFDRIVAGHALSLFAIELAKARAVAEAERRFQGDFLDDLASGRLSAPDAIRGLARFGFARESNVVAVSIEGGEPEEVATAATDTISRSGGAFIVSPSAEGANLLLPAEPAPDLDGLATAVGGRLGVEVRAGGGSPAAVADVARSLREARYALRVCRLEGWGHAGFEDLGTYRLLLSMAEPDALRAFADSMLGPILAYDREHGGELASSLQAFLLHNARWEAAAAHLFVHRHTLRYRMRKVQDLTGRDLSKSFDRMEFWLALRAHDLLTEEADRP